MVNQNFDQVPNNRNERLSGKGLLENVGLKVHSNLGLAKKISDEVIGERKKLDLSDKNMKEFWNDLTDSSKWFLEGEDYEDLMARDNLSEPERNQLIKQLAIDFGNDEGERPLKLQQLKWIDVQAAKRLSEEEGEKREVALVALVALKKSLGELSHEPAKLAKKKKKSKRQRKKESQLGEPVTDMWKRNPYKEMRKKVIPFFIASLAPIGIGAWLLWENKFSKKEGQDKRVDEVEETLDDLGGRNFLDNGITIEGFRKIDSNNDWDLALVDVAGPDWFKEYVEQPLEWFEEPGDRITLKYYQGDNLINLAKIWGFDGDDVDVEGAHDYMNQIVLLKLDETGAFKESDLKDLGLLEELIPYYGENWRENLDKYYEESTPSESEEISGKEKIEGVVRQIQEVVVRRIGTENGREVEGVFEEVLAFEESMMGVESATEAETQAVDLAELVCSRGFDVAPEIAQAGFVPEKLGSAANILTGLFLLSWMATRRREAKRAAVTVRGEEVDTVLEQAVNLGVSIDIFEQLNTIRKEIVKGIKSFDKVIKDVWEVGRTAHEDAKMWVHGQILISKLKQGKAMSGEIGDLEGVLMDADNYHLKSLVKAKWNWFQYTEKDNPDSELILKIFGLIPGQENSLKIIAEKPGEIAKYLSIVWGVRQRGNRVKPVLETDPRLKLINLYRQAALNL